MWSTFKSNSDDSEQPIHEMDLLSGHENDVNYVQFRLASSWLDLHLVLLLFREDSYYLYDFLLQWLLCGFKIFDI